MATNVVTKTAKTTPPPIAPKPKISLKYIKNPPTIKQHDDSLKVPERKKSTSGSLCSDAGSINDVNLNKTNLIHTDTPLLVEGLSGNVDPQPADHPQDDLSTTNIENEKLACKPLRAPPRSKRQSIKPSPSVRRGIPLPENTAAISENQVPSHEEHTENLPVVMRNKSDIAPTPANRSSRPIRGTLMMAVGDLFSKVKEEEQPKFVRRRTPQWSSQRQLLADTSPTQNESADSDRSSISSSTSNTTGHMDVNTQSADSSPRSLSNASETESSTPPVAAPRYQPKRISQGHEAVDTLNLVSSSVERSQDSSSDVVSEQVNKISNSNQVNVTDAGHTATLSEKISEPDVPCEIEEQNGGADLKICNKTEEPRESVYGALWSSHAVIAGIGSGMAASSVLIQSASDEVAVNGKQSPKPARRPSEPPPAPPSLLSKSPAENRKLLPVRPPPPVPLNKVIKTESLARPPHPYRPSLDNPPGISADQSTTQPHKQLPQVPSSSSLDEQLYTDIDESEMCEPSVYIDPETIEDLISNNAHKSEYVAPAPSILSITPEPAIPEKTVEAAVEKVSHELSEDNSEDEYMTPVNSEQWPEGTAPVPKEDCLPSSPNNHEAVPGNFKAKTATLQSVTSNIYEDLIDSSTDGDDDGSAVGTSTDRGDVFSDCLDETFENEDIAKGSSSESEPEAEETDEEKLKKKKQKVFNVAKEIMTSEEEFIDKLKLLNIDFRKHISDKTSESGEHLIPPQSMNKILNYLPQLSEINADLLQDVKLRIDNWNDDPRIADIFVKKGPFLQMYTTYISNFQSMTSELDQAFKEYPMFAEALQEFEKSPRCRNLQLRHYMLKPIQRIPQYRMLLSQYQKYVLEDSPDVADTQTALDIVSKVAEHANEAMKQNDSLQSLLELQNLLVGDFKVIEPSRVLVRKGDMYKQSRKELQPRTLFLFNDYLVITTPQPGSGNYKIKHSLPLLNMRVEKSTREDFQKEFIIRTKKRSFTSVAFTPRERDEWTDILLKTVEEQERKQGTYNRSLGDVGSREYKLGEVAPVWIPDDRVTMCMTCSDAFTLLNRRHHCRACGKVVCGTCSGYKAPLKYEEDKQKRVCERCFDKLLEEAEHKQEEEQHNDSVAEGDNTNVQLRTPNKEDRRRLFVRATRETIRTPKRSKPTVLQEVHADADEQGVMSGYLHVMYANKNNTSKKWKKFWFVLKDKVLYKYNASEDRAAIESKPLLGFKVAQVGTAYDGFDKNVMFRLHHPAMDIIEPVIFKTDTAAVADKWISMMHESTTA